MNIRGRQWYYYIKAESDRDKPGKGLLDDYSRQNLSSLTVCCMEHPKDGQKLYGVFDSYIDLGIMMKSISEGCRHFHEVIFGECYQKPHFDIDVEPRPTDKQAQRFIDELVTAIIETFKLWPHIEFIPEKHIIICHSHGKHKLSYHIIIDGFLHSNNYEAEDFCYYIKSKLSPEFQNWLDLGVYSKLHQLRILNSVKRGTERIKIFAENWVYRESRIKYEYQIPPETEDHKIMMQLQSSLITYTSGSKTLPFLRQQLPDKIVSAILPYRRPEADCDFAEISDEIAKSAIRLLAELAGMSPDSRKFPYRYQATRGGIVLLERIRASHCRICNRRHDTENPYLTVNSKGHVYFYCRRNKDGNKLYVGSLSLDPEPPDPILTITPKIEGDSALGFMNTIKHRSKLPTLKKNIPRDKLTANGYIDTSFIF